MALEATLSLPRRRFASTVTLAVGLVVCAALVSSVLPILTFGYDYEKFYSEGWNAYHAMRAAAGAVTA
jgi:hypothetical protein